MLVDISSQTIQIREHATIDFDPTIFPREGRRGGYKISRNELNLAINDYLNDGGTITQLESRGIRPFYS